MVVFYGVCGIKPPSIGVYELVSHDDVFEKNERTKIEGLLNDNPVFRHPGVRRDGGDAFVDRIFTFVC